MSIDIATITPPKPEEIKLQAVLKAARQTDPDTYSVTIPNVTEQDKKLFSDIRKLLPTAEKTSETPGEALIQIRSKEYEAYQTTLNGHAKG